MLSMNDVVIDFGNMCLYIGDLIVLDSLFKRLTTGEMPDVLP